MILSVRLLHNTQVVFLFEIISHFSMNSEFAFRTDDVIYLGVYYLMLAKLTCCVFGNTDGINNLSSHLRVLNVAENEDVAKNVARFLSDGNARTRNGILHGNKIYEFEYNLRGEKRQMIMTSVSGHLLSFAFTGMYKSWTASSPASLFDAPLVKTCPTDYEHVNIKCTLENEIQACDTLVIWTDYDNEGENIGSEIASVCTAVNPNITIYRAKFSEITAKSVRQAMGNLGTLNKYVSDAADVRAELDLRTGAAFTRFQTLRLQQVFPNLLRDNVVSYGSLQFPTLRLVVDRYVDIKNFKAEPLWKIKATHTENNLTMVFTWKRFHTFEKETCRILFSYCQDPGEAQVEDIKSKLVPWKRPEPLNTLNLQMSASEKLKLAAKTVMEVAEKLYSEGLISYPRSECNIFPKEMDLVSLVKMQKQDIHWGEFASRVLEKGINPRRGKIRYHCHPPVHPVKYTNSLTGTEATVYEFIVRHFLACLSEDAVGNETVVHFNISGEKFFVAGLNVLEHNYLEVYPYDQWPNRQIHDYEIGQSFVPSTLEMVTEGTPPPEVLTEAKLIQLMEDNGIGTTDATYGEAIDKLKSRSYIRLENGTHFVPGPLGIGLVEGYNNMGIELSEPTLRVELEADLQRICSGEKDPKKVLAAHIDKYRKLLKIAQRKANKLDAALSRYLPHKPVPIEDNQIMGNWGGPVMKCPKCGSDIVLRSRRNNKGYYLSCLGFPKCRVSMWFPENVVKAEVSDHSCSICGPQVKKLRFEFKPGSMKPYFPDIYVGCVNGCEPYLLNLMHVRPFSGTATTRKYVPDDIRLTSIEGSMMSSYQRGNDDILQAATRKYVPDDIRLTSIEGSMMSSYQRGNDDILQEEKVYCQCGIPAIKRVVKKEGANKGREFYSCSKPRNEQCGFLQWTDNTPSGGGNSRGRNYQSQPSATNRFTATTDEKVFCNCGLPAVKRVVKKEGANKGREFYSCSKPRNQQCNFLKWVDDIPSGAGSSRGRNYQSRPSAINRFTATTGEKVYCDCGLPAVKLTVKEESINKGRQFYKCPKPIGQRCNFIKWGDNAPTGTDSRGRSYRSQPLATSGYTARTADDRWTKGLEDLDLTRVNEEDSRITKNKGNYGSDARSSSRRKPSKWSPRSNQNSDMPRDGIKCDCGLPAKKLTVIKESKNKGRQFYVCPKPQGQQCSFYKWADETNPAPSVMKVTRKTRRRLRSTLSEPTDADEEEFQNEHNFMSE